MRLGSRRSCEGTSLLLAGGTVSPMIDNRRTTTKAGQETSQAGRDKDPKTISRPQQSGGFC